MKTTLIILTANHADNKRHFLTFTFASKELARAFAEKFGMVNRIVDIF